MLDEKSVSFRVLPRSIFSIDNYRASSLVSLSTFILYPVFCQFHARQPSRAKIMRNKPLGLLYKHYLSNLKYFYKNGTSTRSFNRHHKYVLTGIGGGLAAVSFGNVNTESNIVVGAKGLLRFVRSIEVGLAISLDYYFAMMGLAEGAPNYSVMMSRIHQRCAERIRDGCLQNGGTYVKLGQGLVSLSHLLPREYIDTLKILQDKCLARDKNELYQVFLEDFGHTPEELFEHFDTHPIAAASIAQVFTATTKEGEKVAVKVQYNDLHKRFGSDVMTIDILLRIGAWLHPKIDFSWILNDFVDALKQELDFVKEGLNAEKCARDLAHLKYVHIPKVLWKYTNTRVLVTEFIEGIKINDTEKLKEEGFSLVDVNNKLFEAFGYQIFQTGFVHADPHPGNVFVRKFKGQTELIILDHGLYQVISKEERIALSHLWRAMVFGDHAKMQIYSKALGVDDYTMLAEVLTQTPFKTMGVKLKSKLTKDEEEFLMRSAAQRFDQVVKCLQQMPRTLLLVVRNLNTIRAISHEHGCPIDRYAVLARIASKASFESEDRGLIKKVCLIPNKAWFEINLLIIRLLIFWRKLFWSILHKLRLAPDVNALIEQASVTLQ